MPQYPASIDLEDVDGENGFHIATDGARQVAYAGDLNGDGFDDMVLAGTYVVFGRSGGFPATIDPSTLDGEDGFVLTGPAGGVQAVSAAGDVNGDGVDDLIVGAPNDQSAYVVFGRRDGFDAAVDLESLDGANGFRLFNAEGSLPSESTGFTVSAAGDVNGDGFDDVLVGVPAGFYERGSRYGIPFVFGPYGGGYVVYGRSTFQADVDLEALPADQGYAFIDLRSQSFLGINLIDVAAVGDVNGDGFDDYAFGSAFSEDGQGSAAIVFGSAAGPGSGVLSVATLNGTDGFNLTGADAEAGLGFSVSAAGDLNGDGFDDLIVGAIGVDDERGAAYVVFGHAGAFAAELDLNDLDGGDGFAVLGTGTGDRLGFSVAAAGDANGDGFDDLIVGAPYDGADGTAYLLFGRASGFSAVLELSALTAVQGVRLDGAAAGGAGGSVSSADLNGDGLSDQIIAGTDGAYVVFGREAQSPLNLTGTLASQTLVGSRRDDLLNGVGGDDQLWGHAGADALTGGTGNDTLNGGLGRDTTDGGGGNDTHRVDNARDKVVEKNAGGVDVVLASVNYQIGRKSFVERLAADLDAGPLVLTGAARAEVIWGGDANDTLKGGGGDDTLDGFGGVDSLAGGAGNDRYFVQLGEAVFDSGGALDEAFASNGFVLAEGSGIERLAAGAAAGMRLVGDGAAQSIDGGAGVDTLEGGGGNDTLSGGGGADELRGGAGNDTYLFETGDLVIETSGEGFDTLVVRASTVLPANVEALVAAADAGSLALTGSVRNDFVGGAGGNDTLAAGDGSDTLSGGAGDDVLAGGRARASTFGPLWTDRMSGGEGADRFVFGPGNESNVGSDRDVIEDFTRGEDRVDLSAFDGNPSAPRDQALRWLGTAGFDGFAGALRQYEEAGQTIVAADLDGDRRADFEIALGGRAILLSASDFVL